VTEKLRITQCTFLEGGALTTLGFSRLTAQTASAASRIVDERTAVACIRSGARFPERPEAPGFIALYSIRCIYFPLVESELAKVSTTKFKLIRTRSNCRAQKKCAMSLFEATQADDRTASPRLRLNLLHANTVTADPVVVGIFFVRLGRLTT
jgi:hypothetical protein